MIPNLTNPQRVVAVTTAAVIGVVLWIQVEEYGLGDTQWLAGLLAISALLLLSVRGQGKQQPEIISERLRDTKTGKKTITLEQAFCSARNHMERFYKEHGDRVRDTKLRSEVMVHQAVLIRQAAFMAAFLVMEKKLNGFAHTKGADQLRQMGLRGISEIVQFEEDLFRRALPAGLAAHAKSVQEIGDETAAEMLKRAEAAVTACKPLLFRDEAYPIDPILAVLNDVVPLANANSKERDRIYGPTFKSLFRVLDAREAVGVNMELASTPHQRSGPQPHVPLEIRTAVEGLLDHMMEKARAGEQPETMLIPHIRIKLEIIVAAYSRDMKRAISQLYDQQLGRDEVGTRSAGIRADVEKMTYDLRREPSHRIEQLFNKMFKQRTDMAEIEREVRAANPQYGVVPPLS